MRGPQRASEGAKGPLPLLGLGLLLCWGGLATVSAQTKHNYSADWASLDTRPLPSWYADAKFGIFIHWGVYSVPAWSDHGDYAEWYWYNQVNNPSGPIAAFHNKTYGPDFHYTQFADMFKAELFSPAAWADLFRRSGAKYVVPTAKHHEGFTLWPSAQAWNWNAKDVGPHRDLLGDLLSAVRAAGLHPGVYFSLYEWFNPLYNKQPDEYVQQVCIPQWYDLINTYKPDVLWSDGDGHRTSDFWQAKPFVAWLFNQSPVSDSIVINDRFGQDVSMKHGSFYTAEYSGQVWLSHAWEENSGIDVFSYGFNRNTPEDMYFTTDYLLNLLVRTVANGGNLLLDIGPAGDGSIATVFQQRLLEMGDWLHVNGEAIYSTRIWRVQQEGPIDKASIRYTYSPVTGAVYAHVLTWPSSGVLTLPSPIATNNTQVTLLGAGPGERHTNTNTNTNIKPHTSNKHKHNNNHMGTGATQGHTHLPLQHSVPAWGVPGLSVMFPCYDPSSNPVQHIWVLKLLNVQ